MMWVLSLESPHVRAHDHFGYRTASVKYPDIRRQSAAIVHRYKSSKIKNTRRCIEKKRWVILPDSSPRHPGLLTEAPGKDREHIAWSSEKRDIVKFADTHGRSHTRLSLVATGKVRYTPEVYAVENTESSRRKWPWIHAR
jgi:hypothetical protein